MKPNLRVIDNEREHNLDYARRKVKEWRSDAARRNLPLSNQHDSGAAVLDVESTLNRTLPNCVGKK